jgi:hypothetical protein
MTITYQTDAERAQTEVIRAVRAGRDILARRVEELEAENARLRKSAERFDFLFGQLMERGTPDGRAVLELDPIWVKPEGTSKDWILAIDAAMDSEG